MKSPAPLEIHLNGQHDKRGMVEVFSDQEQLVTHVPINVGTSTDLKCVVFSVGPVRCLPQSYVRFSFQLQLINRLKFAVDVGRMVVRSSHPNQKNGDVVLAPTDSYLTPEMRNLVVTHSGIDVFRAGGGLKNQYYNLVIWANSPEARVADVLQMPEDHSEFFLEHFIGQ